MRIDLFARWVLAAAVAGVLGTVAFAKDPHFVFPDPNHPDYGQVLEYRTFELNQTEPRAFRYGCEAKCAGLDPETPPSHSNFGMSYHVVYADGTDKWGEPKARLSPTTSGEMPGVLGYRWKSGVTGRECVLIGNLANATRKIGFRIGDRRIELTLGPRELKRIEERREFDE